MEKATVKADMDQLESIGIGYDISELEGDVKGYYSSGYVLVEITHNLDGFEFTNEFDIPKRWLKIREEE